MENLEANAWVFDSLVGFLHGPIWNVPLQTFIEEKSLPFEPSDCGEIQDKAEYKKIHDAYRNLVDVMLGSFMDDIGISADQFEAACKLSARDLAGLPAHFHQRLFEQIWAANDYEMFVKMMTHKNVELQLQALELIERRYGTMPLFSNEPEDLDSSRSTETSDEWPDNDDVMTEIKNLQLNDFEDKDEVSVPPEDVVAEKQTLLTKLHSFEKKDDIVSKKSEKSVTFDEKKIRVIEPPIPPAQPKVEVSEDEMRVRQEYLKQQRDKLLALKKQVRERRLGAAEMGAETGGEGSQGNMSRPRSARVAAVAALAGAAPAPPPDAMQLRRALASKLKTEVVDTAH